MQDGVFGKDGNLAKKYEAQGLRVIAIDADASEPAAAYKKWKTSGKLYPMYTREKNCLIHFFGDKTRPAGKQKYFPHYPCIKANKKIAESPDTTVDVTWEDYIVRVFGLKKA